MTLNYKKLKNWDVSENTGAILRISPNPKTWIPFDPANTDYQEYLEWVAEGNTPDPAD